MRDIVSLGLSVRTSNKLKVRQPLERAVQVPQADRLLHDFFVGGASRWNNQKWNVQFGLIETGPVAEDAGVLAEAFPVVGGNNQPSSTQNSAAR